MRFGGISYVTALRLSRGEASAISFNVLNSLCKLFDVSIDQILEYFPDHKG